MKRSDYSRARILICVTHLITKYLNVHNGVELGVRELFEVTCPKHLSTIAGTFLNNQMRDAEIFSLFQRLQVQCCFTFTDDEVMRNVLGCRLTY